MNRFAAYLAVMLLWHRILFARADADAAAGIQEIRANAAVEPSHADPELSHKHLRVYYVPFNVRHAAQREPAN